MLWPKCSIEWDSLCSKCYITARSVSLTVWGRLTVGQERWGRSRRKVISAHLRYKKGEKRKKIPPHTRNYMLSCFPENLVCSFAAFLTFQLIIRALGTSRRVLFSFRCNWSNQRVCNTVIKTHFYSSFPLSPPFFSVSLPLSSFCWCLSADQCLFISPSNFFSICLNCLLGFFLFFCAVASLRTQLKTNF